MKSLNDFWQEQRRQRQQELADRQQRVRQSLATINKERCNKASQLRQTLANKNQVRYANAQLLQAELQQFCHNLQVDVRTFLNTSRDRRRTQAEQLKVELETFVQALQQETAEFMALTTMERETMADQLRRTLQADRIARTAQVQTMFAQFARFRTDLQRYRTQLQTTVWGNSKDPLPPAASEEVSISEKNLKAILDRLAEATPPAPAAGVGTAQVGSAPVGNARNGSPVALASVPAATPEQPISSEEQVYNYLYQTHGARITEIESSLGINRFQAVDALRSLIKKGAVTQRDRVYLVQEKTHA
jgi:arsenate reductase-like glutaredoxin family protein